MRNDKYLKNKVVWGVAGLILMVVLFYKVTPYINFNFGRQPGAKIDEFQGVSIYFNGGVRHTAGRNTSNDGYNIGIKWQCVEFVKRYYYERFQHKMPDSYGHAKDFFDTKLSDQQWNGRRGLYQFQNNSASKPKISDILVFKGTFSNRFGHVAIISDVTEDDIEIVQQNPGPFSPSRKRIRLTHSDAGWKIEHERVLGWLGKRI